MFFTQNIGYSMAPQPGYGAALPPPNQAYANPYAQIQPVRLLLLSSRAPSSFLPQFHILLTLKSVPSQCQQFPFPYPFLCDLHDGGEKGGGSGVRRMRTDEETTQTKMQYSDPGTQKAEAEGTKQKGKEKRRRCQGCMCECGDVGWNPCSLKSWLVCCCCQCCCGDRMVFRFVLCSHTTTYSYLPSHSQNKSPGWICVLLGIGACYRSINRTSLLSWQ